MQKKKSFQWLDTECSVHVLFQINKFSLLLILHAYLDYHRTFHQIHSPVDGKGKHILFHILFIFLIILYYLVQYLHANIVTKPKHMLTYLE